MWIILKEFLVNLSISPVEIKSSLILSDSFDKDIIFKFLIFASIFDIKYKLIKQKIIIIYSYFYKIIIYNISKRNLIIFMKRIQVNKINFKANYNDSFILWKGLKIAMKYITLNIVIKISILIFFTLSVIYSYSMNILSLTIYSNIQINNESIYIFIDDSFFSLSKS